MAASRPAKTSQPFSAFAPRRISFGRIHEHLEVPNLLAVQTQKLDALKTQVFRELLTYMLQDPHKIEPSLDLILVSRHLERIGDHATNIAEDVIFMVSARDVRHHAH